MLQVREDVGRRVGQAVEDVDRAALLGDEDLAVGGEGDSHRVVQAGPDGLVGEAGGYGRTSGRDGRRG